MISIEGVYQLLGLFLAGAAFLSAVDRLSHARFANAAFWGLLAVCFLFGAKLSDLEVGVIVLTLAGLGGTGFLRRTAPPTTTTDERIVFAMSRGNRLFLPLLLIPVVTLAGAIAARFHPWATHMVLDAGQTTVIALAAGVLLATAASMIWLRPPLSSPLQEGRRLLDAVGWTAVLPQMLAALGAIFSRAGVGGVVGHLAASWLPLERPFSAVLVYCCGMAAFTMLMGNAFAAFPVMTAAIGLPLLIVKFGGDPAIIGAIGMLSGFCGTLVTPMAANFNLVPAALLELPDRYAVIKVQAPTAAVVLVANIALMYTLAFHH
jgi:uncharacterized membrane protein